MAKKLNWERRAWDVLGLLVTAKDEIGGLKKRLDASDRENARLSHELAEAEDCELTLAGELRRADAKCAALDAEVVKLHEDLAAAVAQRDEAGYELMATQITGEYERGYELGGLAGEKEILSTREDRDRLRERIKRSLNYLEDPANWSTFDARRSLLRGLLSGASDPLPGEAAVTT